MSAVQKADESGIGALNNLIMNGDMSKLTRDEKLQYYHGICKSIGLNPLTNPFQYMRLNGKEVLYATKGAAEQIRNIKGISVVSQHIDWTDDLVIVTVEGRDKDGRVDTETGFAPCVNLKGDAKGNALLKAITKAKRRLTLSMAGLGMLDETEVESIPSAVKINDVTSDGEVVKDDLPRNICISPFKIQVLLTSKGEPNWKQWARDYYAHLKASPESDLEEWIELNNDAFENFPPELNDIQEKIADLVDSRVAKVLDREAV